jgi:hypothetical protein
MISAFFGEFTQRTLLGADVSGQPIGPIFKGEAVQQEFLLGLLDPCDGTDRLPQQHWWQDVIYGAYNTWRLHISPYTAIFNPTVKWGLISCVCVCVCTPNPRFTFFFISIFNTYSVSFFILVGQPFELSASHDCSVDEKSDWGFPNAPAQLATDNKHRFEVPFLYSHLNQNLVNYDYMRDRQCQLSYHRTNSTEFPYILMGVQSIKLK